MLEGYGDNEALVSHSWEDLYSNSVENTERNLITHDHMVHRLHQDWMISSKFEVSKQVD